MKVILLVQKMADTIGIGQLAEALKRISSNDLKKVASGLEMALGIEHESIRFYAAQAEKSKGKAIGQFFLFLAGQEKSHLKAIGELRGSLLEEGKWVEPKLPAKAKPEVFAGKDWDNGAGSEPVAAVLFALWKEKLAQEFYSGAAEKTRNAGAKRFFAALAEFEKTHAEMLGEYAEESFYTHELIMG
jgi:rubrerythrin